MVKSVVQNLRIHFTYKTLSGDELAAVLKHLGLESTVEEIAETGGIPRMTRTIPASQVTSPFMPDSNYRDERVSLLDLQPGDVKLVHRNGVVNGLMWVDGITDARIEELFVKACQDSL
ncbi:MAG: hypothetical protein B7Z37_24995 [Verrucomicrobia bacterium 12-59-8]|nr:MAG: hypothetical protein B7Z37_24995 [Verrucomicrobia bacterium 12-59-8]